MDGSKPNANDIHVDIEPLVLRLSLRDILLVLQIVSKASELSGNEPPKQAKETPAEQKARELRNAGIRQRSGSGRGQSTIAGRSKVTATSHAVTHAADTKAGKSPEQIAQQKFETLSATVDGIRVVLIGDIHELPILDLGIKNFTASAENWSSNLKAETAIDIYTNVYNFAKSSWEPLLEPWQVGFGVAKDPQSGLLSVDVASKKVFDVTITTASIALASKSFQFLTSDEDVLDKPRGVEAPYRIRNYTGFDVVVHSKSPTSDEPINLRLEDGKEAPWSFEHWEKMRENLLTESNQNYVSIQLEGSGFDPVKNVRLNREGEYLYGLRPKTDDVLHRLCVEVELGTDNIKYVTFRSPLHVENATEIPVELGIYDAQEGHLLKIEKIAPGESRPAPVGAVFEKRVLIRPDGGFGYQWSNDHLFWRDLLKRPTKQVVCKGENGDPFYFQVHARFDKANPLTK
jgi:vacuolar protein sorting-associated protein 13A/C